jgi:hypothetical protein
MNDVFATGVNETASVLVCMTMMDVCTCTVVVMETDMCIAGVKHPCKRQGLKELIMHGCGM